MFHIQSKMIFMKKKKIAHNNINILHSHENKTQKKSLHVQVYVSYLKRKKWREKCHKKRERKRTSIPTLFRLPAFKKLQYEQSEMMEIS